MRWLTATHAGTPHKSPSRMRAHLSRQWASPTTCSCARILRSLTYCQTSSSGYDEAVRLNESQKDETGEQKVMETITINDAEDIDIVFDGVANGLSFDEIKSAVIDHQAAIEAPFTHRASIQRPTYQFIDCTSFGAAMAAGNGLQRIAYANGYGIAEYGHAVYPVVTIEEITQAQRDADNRFRTFNSQPSAPCYGCGNCRNCTD